MAPATKAEAEAPHDVILRNRRVADAFVVSKTERESQKRWDAFYKTNETRFFKNRNWTDSEFTELRAKQGDEANANTSTGQDASTFEQLEPDLLAGPSSRLPVLLEVGCGVGNTVWPLLKKSEALKVHCCDFSPRGVDFVKMHPLYSEDRVHAFVHDLVAPQRPLHEIVAEHVFGPPTVITMLFVLSAVAPDRHLAVLEALAACLRLSGEHNQDSVILFRDYAYLDLAQVRFHARVDASYREPALLSDSHPYYKRGDGTTTYFFEPDKLGQLAAEAGLEGPIEVVCQTKINRKLDSKMERRFVQAKWRLRPAPS